VWAGAVQSSYLSHDLLTNVCHNGRSRPPGALPLTATCHSRPSRRILTPVCLGSPSLPSVTAVRQGRPSLMTATAIPHSVHSPLSRTAAVAAPLQ
jgi:hypothetical protein